MVKLSSFVASRPVLVFVILAFLVLLVPSIVIPNWYKATKSIKENVGLVNENIRSGLVSEIEIIGKTIYQTGNSSATGLAKVVESSLNNNTHQPTFTDIQTQVAPVLFQAYSVNPRISQVSHIGTDGLFFSFFTGRNTTVFAIFANQTSSSTNYTWYLQHVDQTTGRLSGDAAKLRPPGVTRTDWFPAPLSPPNNDTDGCYAALGTRWGDKANNTLFLNTVGLSGERGAVSLGFPVKALTDAFKRLSLHGGELFLATTEGTMLLEGSVSASFFVSNSSVCFRSESESHHGRDRTGVRCFPGNGTSGHNVLGIGRSKFRVYCSALEVAGAPLVYALMFPDNGGVEARVAKNSETALFLLVLTSALSLISTLIFVLLMVRAAKREMHLCATLINQMEATQQAERKSMNKSLAFASASHDIRGALAGVTGLIDLCREETEPGSEVDTSLRQMKVCTKDLVALLNSVLDLSKIEFGKMQLEEEEFNLVDLLEEVVDSFHPVAMKKSVDVVLDPHDGSILAFPYVRGDRGKLKQILNNLVSNAVKFTSNGHVSIRAWAQKSGSKSFVVLTTDADGGVMNLLRCMLCSSNHQSSSNMETVHSMRKNTNTMEFVFEVDDTGKGIPKEMQRSVFENYVQVREAARGQQGTGLGLGIVQSLVRLMGGEIRIVDKDVGQRGTCFRFNIFLTTSESPTSDTTMRQDVEDRGDTLATPNLGLTIRTSSSTSRSIWNLSPRLNNIFLNSSPKLEGSPVVLLLKDEERRRVTQKYVESLGINVTVVEKWEHLDRVLKRVKSKLCGSSPQNSLGRIECSSRSEISSSSSKEFPLSATEGIDRRSQLPARRNSSVYGFILLLIDANTGPFFKLYNTVEEFREGLHQGICCKVVWLNKQIGRGDDLGFLKPLHISRLNQVMKMLPEFGGRVPKETTSELQRELSMDSLVAETSLKNKKIVNTEMQQEDSNSSYDRKLGEPTMTPSPPERETQVKRSFRHSVRTIKPAGKTEDSKGTSEQSDEKCLRGKRILVVDDQISMALISNIKLKKLGASTVETCENGREAVRLVTEQLEQRNREGSMDGLPFDYIFMDCQMPEMDGYEATREIRRAERQYGIHIPIIALSAHDHDSKESREAIDAGMDVFLGKELNITHLVNATREIESKMTLHRTIMS